MIQELIDSECIKTGSFTLKNGENSNYYFDIKNIISTPTLLTKICDQLYSKLNEFDIVCGIPYGGLPLAAYISTKYNKPLIYIRNHQKNYGTKQLIEGKFDKTDRCVIIDDVITTGGSIREAINILNNKVNIVDIGVVLDRRDTISNNNSLYNVNALFYKDEIISYYEK